PAVEAGLERALVEHSPGDEAGMIHVRGEDPAWKRAGAGAFKLDQEIPRLVARETKPPPIYDELLDESHNVMLDEGRGRHFAQAKERMGGHAEDGKGRSRSSEVRSQRSDVRE